MKRILYFHHGGAIGGAPLSLLFLIQKLDRSRYEPVVVTTRPGPVHDLYKRNGIEIHLADDIAGRIDDFSHTTLEWYGLRHWWPLPGRLLRFSASVRHACQIVEHFKPDVVHLNSSTLAMAALGVHQTGTPMVWHIREPLVKGYLGLRRRWLRNLIDRTADRVVSISNSDAARLKASDRIRIIYNFVDLEQFDRTLTDTGVREELGLAADDCVVVMLGGAAKPKGTTVFIEALPFVLERYPNAFFLIAGPTPRTLDEGGVKGLAKQLLGADAYKRRVLRLLDQVDTQERLMFTGVRQDIPNILAMSEMLVFSSTVPHFARPVIEASAMGKPAVASNLGGPAELIVDGETGLLVPPNNPVALADAICKLLEDPVLAKEMGDAGHARALEHFNAEINARNTLALYDEIMAND